METRENKKNKKLIEKEKEFDNLSFKPDINKKSRRLAGSGSL